MEKFIPWIKKIQKVKETSYKFSNLPEEIYNSILKEIKDKIVEKKQQIFSENKKDVLLAEKNNLSKALVDRLTLTEKRFDEMVSGIDTVISLESPVNKIIARWERNVKNNKFIIEKVKVPLGVILMIYESRPNVTIDSTVLCIKSGNCVILRGGSETINTNKILVKIVNEAINNVWQKFSMKDKKDVVLFIDNPSYELLYKILTLHQYIDLVIPRGGEKMVNTIKRKSLIPVLSHGSGVCHTYVDKDANIDVALKVCFNAKVQRPSVCNAMETLLVHTDVAEKFLPKMAKMYIDNNVELRGCSRTVKLLKKYNLEIKPAKPSDWGYEFLDYILAVKIVDNIDEAITHINHYGSHHSDAIISENKSAQLKFWQEVDSSAVFINSSTRLHDGGVFGFGTEIGISTSKLHARGTMGVNELTTTKYVVVGNGAIRE
ncbi:MAG: glutamate-5-semialdehyde dehydrogenase [Endomicrobia bacterium]|nr:glutamate-5-semialdehyde dehydrogenase [Endomicrobiia bacterium]MCX7941224.1 glutamate-5-semialdehyde dehydrogenase [Endomicrobiia bacterium]MDW8056082.1 glutamate-5-semialdehyde dehydrogenase [Elusimicrobiota bacterium]